jgi:hypothetical protein
VAVAAVVAVPILSDGILPESEANAAQARGLLDGTVETAADPTTIRGYLVDPSDAGDVPVDTAAAADAVAAAVGAAAPGGGQVPGPQDASRLAANGIPDVTLRAYQLAAAALGLADPTCRLDWALLAGIGRVESNHGRFAGAVVTTDGVSVPSIIGIRLDGSVPNTVVHRDTDQGRLDGDTEYDRAVGPMQFLPGSWSIFGADGDGDGIRNPQDIDDAALAAAAFLCSGSDDLSTLPGASAAVRRYNNSGEYVNLVLALADAYRSQPLPAVLPASPVPPSSVPVLPTFPTVPAAPATPPIGLAPTPVVVTPPPTATATTATPTATSTTSRPSRTLRHRPGSTATSPGTTSTTSSTASSTTSATTTGPTSDPTTTTDPTTTPPTTPTTPTTDPTTTPPTDPTTTPPTPDPTTTTDVTTSSTTTDATAPPTGTP